MNEKEQIFRTMITPVLKDLAKLCRLNRNAFVAIVEVEPGKVIQISYLTGKSTLRQSLASKSDAVDHNERYEAERLNEEKINIAKGIRAERG